jgi:hypothetical protein
MDVSQSQRISIYIFRSNRPLPNPETRPQATRKIFERMVTHFTGAGNIFLNFFGKESPCRTILQEILRIVRKSCAPPKFRPA